tara:strand:+ start:3506 stop:4519 length:1014 start_codon:yes stop_codon:yes gene_type:complete
MAQADENLIYYNIDVKNETQERIIPSFNINRVQAVLDDPSEYEMAIVRFSLPLTSIPLFLFKNDIFKVSLKIGASEYTESIVWIPNNNVYDDKNVYEIQHLLNMINTAWALAFTTLKSANTVASTTPPFMTHSSLTNLITLFVPQTYLTDNIDVYTNSNMHRRLHSFYDFYNEFVSVGELNYRFIVQDLFDNNTVFNGVNYYYFTQLFSSIGSLTDLKSIQVFTNSVPVNRELIAGQKNVIDNFLTDFEPIESNTFNSNGFFQFFPEGPLRYIDLLSTEPMKRIDLEIKWTTKDRQTETYYLQPNEQLSMKILFRKKQNLILDEFISEQIHDKIKSE